MTRTTAESTHTRATVLRALDSMKLANDAREFRDDLEREGALARMTLGFLLDITDTRSFAGWEADVLATAREWWKGSPEGSGKGSGKGSPMGIGKGSGNPSIGRIVALGSAIVETSRDLSRDGHAVGHASVTPLHPTDPSRTLASSVEVAGVPAGSGEACCDDLMDGSHPWDEVTDR